MKLCLVDLESFRCMWTYQLKNENEGTYKRKFLASFLEKKKKINILEKCFWGWREFLYMMIMQSLTGLSTSAGICFIQTNSGFAFQF